ncbi:MAG: glycosyltransferase, partial [Muribaculaceae bacterium]|nr:glycosyltransferase [Muribaculaceae bacterium]
ALGKPVVWTMHDQWNMTGVCHYTSGCERWKETCGHCPLIARGKHPKDLSTAVQRAKQRLYADVPIHFVAVSNRLGELARASSLMSNADISVIPNAFPVNEFSPVTDTTRAGLGLPDGKRLVVMGAARLDDPVKDLPLAIEALNRVSTPGVHAVLFGDLRDRSLLERLKIDYTWTGPIDSSQVSPIMSHADVVLSTSVWETWGATLAEGIASGATAVATSNGGQNDIITDGVTGYLAHDRNPQTIARLIDRALSLDFSPEGRLRRHDEMARRFAADAVAARYLDLFNRLTLKTTSI